MTSIHILRPGRPSLASRLLSPVTALPGLLARRLKAYQARRDTTAALEALPFDLLKDIGWPGSDTPHASRSPRRDVTGKRA